MELCRELCTTAPEILNSCEALPSAKFPIDFNDFEIKDSTISSSIQQQQPSILANFVTTESTFFSSLPHSNTQSDTIGSYCPSDLVGSVKSTTCLSNGPIIAHHHYHEQTLCGETDGHFCLQSRSTLSAPSLTTTTTCASEAIDSDMVASASESLSVCTAAPVASYFPITQANTVASVHLSDSSLPPPVSGLTFASNQMDATESVKTLQGQREEGADCHLSLQDKCIPMTTTAISVDVQKSSPASSLLSCSPTLTEQPFFSVSEFSTSFVQSTSTTSNLSSHIVDTTVYNSQLAQSMELLNSTLSLQQQPPPPLFSSPSVPVHPVSSNSATVIPSSNYATINPPSVTETSVSAFSYPVVSNFDDGLSALPPSLRSANLPPSFPLTLVPSNPNGEFPAVQLTLPDLPTVILQVLPLPGAKMGEQYTINVPTPLILNGINSALANSGSFNNGGGPIMLSIAPSGSLPPPPPCSAPATLMNSVSSSHSWTVPVPPMCFSSTLPSPSLPSVVVTSALPPISVAKRMRAIAPKPCQNISLQSATTTSSQSVSMPNRSSNTKQRHVSNSTLSGTNPMSLASVTAAAAVACSVASNSQAITKSRKLSVPVNATNVSRSQRNRRKHSSVTTSALNISTASQNQAGSTICYPTDSFITPQATIQPPMVHPTPFTSQPLLIPNSSGTIVSTNSVIPPGPLSQTFVFGGTLPPPGAAANGQPYILPQPFQFPNGCTPFPTPLYNPPPSCTTSVPSTGHIPVIQHSLPSISSSPIFPAGGTPAALAAVDPTMGLVTPYPNPCVPMAVPYSGSGCTTIGGPSIDQNAAFGVSIVYSQSNPNTMGFIVPNGSQSAGPLVYPPPVLPPTTNYSEQPTLNTPSFLSSYPSISSHLSSTATAATPNGLHPQLPLSVPAFPSGQFIPQVSTVETDISAVTGGITQPTLLYPHTDFSHPASGRQSTIRTTDEYLSSSSCTNDEMPKDDLITIAWRLTQMEDEEIVDNAIRSCSIPKGGNTESAMDDAQFYSDDVYALNQEDLMGYEHREVVLLDGSSPCRAAPQSPQSQSTVPTSSTSSTETTGNADIDALLAAAAMVGAASGEGDAQSAVTVAVPCTLPDVTLATQSLDEAIITTTTTMTPASSIINSATLSGSPLHVSSLHNSPASADRQVSTPSAADVLLANALLDDFSKSVCHSAFNHHHRHHTPANDDMLTEFGETDDATSLAAVLGCNADDAADLESVLNPTSDVPGAVSDSFLNSLVSQTGLEMTDGDEEEVDPGEVTDDVDPIFHPDFDVCAPTSSPEASVVDDKESHAVIPFNDADAADNVTGSQGAGDDQLLPSSRQVRSLLRNTVSTAMAYRLGNSSSRASEKLFDIFDSTQANRSSTENRISHYSTSGMPDDFLGVDDIEYTTAEQFDQALMLLGPPPTSPCDPRSGDADNEQFMESDNLFESHVEQLENPMIQFSSICEPLHDIESPSDKHSSSEVVSPRSFKSDNLLECSDHNLTDSNVMEKDDRSVSKSNLNSPSNTDVDTQMIEPNLQESATGLPCDVSNNLADSTLPMILPGGDLELSTSSFDDGDATVAMCCTDPANTSTNSPQTPTKAVSGGSVGDDRVTGTYQFMCAKRDRLRSTISAQLSPSSPSVSSTPNSHSQMVSNHQNHRRRRRFSSMPGLHLVEIRVLTTRTSEMDVDGETNQITEYCRADLTRSENSSFKSPSSISIDPSSTTSSSGKPSSSSIQTKFTLSVDYSSISSAASEIPPPSHPVVSPDLTNVSHNQPISSPDVDSTSDEQEKITSYHSNDQSINNGSSLLGVLVSSSALLEEAVAAAPIDSDSEDSPVKQSNSEALASLDRILKRCQRQTQHQEPNGLLLLSTESKSTISTVSTSSEPPFGLTESAAECVDGSSATSPQIEAVATTSNSSSSQPFERSKRSVPRNNKRGRRKAAQITRGHTKKSIVLSNNQPDEECQKSYSPAESLSELSLPPSLIPTSSRPLSFGFSCDAGDPSVTHINPLLRPNFEHHLPQLHLVTEGHLFPEFLLSSPVHETAETNITCSSISKSPSHSYQPTCESDPLPNESVDSHPPLMKQKPHQRRGRRRKLRNKENKNEPATKRASLPLLLSETKPNSWGESLCCSSLPVIIEPVHLSIPSSDAPFFRFVNDADLPTFATVVRSMESSPNVHPVNSLWKSPTDNHNVLFRDTLTKNGLDISLPDHTSHQKSVVVCPATTSSSTPLLCGSAEISQSSTLPTCSQMNLSSISSSTPSSLSIQDPCTPTSEKHWPPLPFADFRPLTKDLLKNSGSSTAATSWSSTINPSGMTFGSFAGAAAFRATSFGALAAKANRSTTTTTTTTTPLVPTAMPSFSDLAKQSNVSWAHPSVPVEKPELNQFAQGKESPTDSSSLQCSPTPTPFDTKTVYGPDGVLNLTDSAPIICGNKPMIKSSTGKRLKKRFRNKKLPNRWRRRVQKSMMCRKFGFKSADSTLLDSPICLLTRLSRTPSPDYQSDLLETEGNSENVDDEVAHLQETDFHLHMDTAVAEVVEPPIQYEVIDISSFQVESDNDMMIGDDTIAREDESQMAKAIRPSTALSESLSTNSDLSQQCDNVPSAQPAIELDDAKDVQTSISPTIPLSTITLNRVEPTSPHDQVSNLNTCSQYKESLIVQGSIDNEYVQPSTLPSAQAFEDTADVQPVTELDGNSNVQHSPLVRDSDEIIDLQPMISAHESVNVVNAKEETELSDGSGCQLPSSPLGADVPTSSSSTIEPVPHPPIRLRLNLKSMAEKPRLILKTRIKLTPTSTPNQSPLVEKCQNPLVVASSTPTSLSIRLKGFNAAHPASNDPIQSANLPTRPHRRRRKKLKQKASTPIKRFKIVSNLYPPVSDSKDFTEPKVVNGLAPCIPNNRRSKSMKPSLRTKLGSERGGSRSMSISNKAWLPSYNPPVRPNTPTNVLSRKFFSTARQERRSNYAQMSRPWRSGLPGSPRKRGGSIRQLPVSMKIPTDSTHISTSRVLKSSTTIRPAGRGRRGRPPTRFRFGGRSVQNTRTTTHLGNNGEERGNSRVSPGLRLVIRLGNANTGSSSNHNPDSNNPLCQTVATPTATPVPSVVGATDVHRSSPDGSRCSTESQFDDLTADSKSTSDFQPTVFEFFVANEAETYMDPLQVQIQRVPNDSSSTGWNYYKRPTPTNRSQIEQSTSNPIHHSAHQTDSTTMNHLVDTYGGNASAQRPIIDDKRSPFRHSKAFSPPLSNTTNSSHRGTQNPNHVPSSVESPGGSGNNLGPVPTPLPNKHKSIHSPILPTHPSSDSVAYDQRQSIAYTIRHGLSDNLGVDDHPGDANYTSTGKTQISHPPDPSSGTGADPIGSSWSRNSSSSLSTESSVQQRALAFAAAHATLDPIVAAHSQAKTYYDQLTSSLFDSFSNRNDGQNEQQQTTGSDLPSSLVDWTTRPGLHLIPPVARDHPTHDNHHHHPHSQTVGEPRTLNQWPWSAPRPAHLPPQETTADGESYLRAGQHIIPPSSSNCLGQMRSYLDFYQNPKTSEHRHLEAVMAASYDRRRPGEPVLANRDHNTYPSGHPISDTRGGGGVRDRILDYNRMDLGALDHQRINGW